MNRQTYIAKTGEADRRWCHVDATDKVLGRLAVSVATILLGKNKPEYTPHVDVGDFVVLTNVEKIRLTGAKADQKVYETFSGYPSGRKSYSYRWMLENKPERLIRGSIRRMMPRNRLSRKQLSKLKIYRGPEHPHQAQCPEECEL